MLRSLFISKLTIAFIWLSVRYLLIRTQFTLMLSALNKARHFESISKHLADASFQFFMIEIKIEFTYM